MIKLHNGNIRKWTTIVDFLWVYLNPHYSLSVVGLLGLLARRCDMAQSTIILQNARSLAAVSHPCRHPISVRSRFTWSSHQVRCAPTRLMPNWGSLSNTFLLEHESGILMTCPSHHILPAFATVRMLGSPYSSASSWFILLLHALCTSTPPKIIRRMRRSNTLRDSCS